MKFESGVHRVQRVPVNDTKIQTSAASVIVLPEPTEVDVVLRPQDIRVDLYRSQGAGGQSVNTTDSAVRLTHIPTGVVVAMQDERSQIQNKKKAMQILRTRVYDLERMRLMEERADLRSKAQGTGDRSDKIRTYNFPQDRITDHRIGLSTTGVERVMSGENLDHILTCLLVADEEERLENFMKQQTQKAK
ncbi:prfA [Symbiodinium microadriaticum]|nr:prfA [Symbiodinium microadriaticum]